MALLELANRSYAGISVGLFYDSDKKIPVIELESESEWSRFTVPADSALDAFEHPYYFESISPECEKRLKEIEEEISEVFEEVAYADDGA